MKDDRAWPVGVFAHNEARHIIPCLNSLAADVQHRQLQIYVLANGCSDGTEQLASEYARSHPNVHLVRIPIGDKANAWNHFVHVIAPADELVFFMDGDVEALPGAFDALGNALSVDQYANAVSALPASGRGRRRYAAQFSSERGIWGNLYCLRGSFVRRLREMNVRIPIGLIGEDGLVAALVKWDLEPRRPWDPARVAVTSAPSAGFQFTSLSPANPHDIRKYCRRLVRYSIRRYQNKMIGSLLKERGIEGMPAHVFDLYKKYRNECGLEWRGLSTVPDWLALRQIRAQRNSKNLP